MLVIVSPTPLPVKKMASKFKHRNLPLLMLQARERVIGRFRPLLHAHGLTEQQWRILRVLADMGTLEPRQIGELCRLSSPSLAGVLARMEEINLVKRERIERDQRRVRVSLTPRSRALAARMAPPIDAIYAAIEAELGPKAIQQLYTALDTLIATLAAEDTPADGS
jgi:homoprotocatechuate degradation regulator HpaR